MSARVGAQEHEFFERGATRESLGSIDSVNTANGNVIVQIPIGPTYAEGGSLSFGLTLWYNSKVWDTDTGTYNNFLESGSLVTYTALPSRKSSAGPGWTLTLGRLIPPAATPGTDPVNSTVRWMYIGPDGGSHYFYPTLHGDTASQQQGVLYSRDGSYLRLREGPGPGEHTVEFPDGLIHTFDSLNRLRRIEDRQEEPNWLKVTYDDPVPGSQSIKDKKDRKWVLNYTEVVLSPSFYPNTAEEHRTYQQLTSVEVPSVDGTSALYSFQYVMRVVDEGCYGPNPAQVVLQFLDEVSLPATDSGRMKYKMDYYDTNLGGCKSGALKELGLTTGGKIRFDYKNFDVHGHCQDRRDGPFLWGRSNWVTTREYIDLDGSSLAKWSYDYRLSVPPTDETDFALVNQCDDFLGEDQASEVLTTRVDNPLGDRTYHFHAIWPIGDTSENGFGRSDYFLPYVKPGVDIAAPGPDVLSDETALPRLDAEGRFLSTVRFDCGEDVEPFDSCRLHRAEYVQYESEVPDDLGGFFAFDAHTNDRNQRVTSQRRLFYRLKATDPPYEVTSAWSRFDGLGHFREMQARSTFPAEGSWSVKTEFNSGVEDLVLDTNGRPITGWGFPSSSPWVLETYSSILKEEGGQASASEYYFDKERGVLLRERMLADTSSMPTRQTNDILLIHEYFPGGNRKATSRYGGDRQNDLGLIDLKDLSPTAWEYRTEWDYDSGVPKIQEEVGAAGGRLLVFSRSVDKNTGLIKSETDAAGVSTQFKYDELGRMTQLIPAADVLTEATYKNAEPGQAKGETTTVEQRGTAGTVSEVVTRDGFGRNAHYEKTVAGQTTYTDFNYGPNGLLAGISTPEYLGTDPSGWTLFSDYDPDGRALKTSMPDGRIVNLTIDGEHKFEERKRVALVGGENGVSHYVYRDSRGRVVAAEDNNVKTSYEYDVEGRLVLVSTPVDTNTTQTRRFAYDNRGFMKSAEHPEKDAIKDPIPNDPSPYDPSTDLYDLYDSMGNVGQMQDKAHFVSYKYDQFGRPSQIHANGLLMEDHFYARDNRENGTDKTAGKLVQTRRHNYREGEDVVVTNTFYYRDPQGRMTDLRTRSTEGFSFEQSMSFDDLGNLSGHVLPHHLTTQISDQLRAVQRTYADTFLRGIDSTLNSGASETVIESLSYHPDGLPQQVFHGNGVRWGSLRDPSGMPRPRRISTSGVADGNDWDSDLYRYDSAGNIKEIGSDTYAYDRFERLVSAKVKGTQEDYAYDQLGNMTRLGGRSFGVESSRNRVKGLNYDGAGNVLFTGDVSYTYDGLNMVTHREGGGLDEGYIYGPGNERIAVIDDHGGYELLTIRDAQNRVVRDYEGNNRSWSVVKDYIYGNDLLASYDYVNSDWRHYHKDHLGSPRLITDGSAAKVSGHTFMPYGQELLDAESVDEERLKFTSHERDEPNQDYMHARFYSAGLGRLFSVDPVLGSPEHPQSWNRYSYAQNNPIQNVDPDGRFILTSIAKVLAGLTGADPAGSAFVLPAFSGAATFVSDITGNETPEDLLAAQLPEEGRREFVTINASSNVVDGVTTVVRAVSGARPIPLAITTSGEGAGAAVATLNPAAAVAFSFFGGYLIGSGVNSLLKENGIEPSDGISSFFVFFNIFVGPNALRNATYGPGQQLRQSSSRLADRVSEQPCNKTSPSGRRECRHPTNRGSAENR